MNVIDDGRGTQATNPVGVILNIKERNAENEGNFTAAQKKLAEKLRGLVQQVHDTGTTYAPNYRKKQISVKVSQARARDKLNPGWEALEKFVTDNNVDVRQTTSGARIYAIKI